WPAKRGPANSGTPGSTSAAGGENVSLVVPCKDGTPPVLKTFTPWVLLATYASPPLRSTPLAVPGGPTSALPIDRGLSGADISMTSRKSPVDAFDRTTARVPSEATNRPGPASTVAPFYVGVGGLLTSKA